MLVVAGMLLIAGAAPLYAVVGGAYVCAGIDVCAAPYVPDEPIVVITGAAADVGVPPENVAAVVGGAIDE
jgi:hypothetical protein